jgi:multisubunit Na+/H+ antiporter MnhC subunit
MKQKLQANKNPINIAVIATAIVIKVAKKSSSPQPVSP